MPSRPKTTAELYAFYFEKVKPLYAAVQNQNKLPNEVLFEIHAAFDHLARIHILEFGESEADCVDKAFSHLKRACLDIFKLKTKETLDKFNELKKIDTSVLDNGEYDRNVRALIHKIKLGSEKARCFEGKYKSIPGDLRSSEAFDLWEPVLADCAEFEQKFYLHPNLEWAKRRDFLLTFTRIFLWIVGTALGTAVISIPLTLLFEEKWRQWLSWLGLGSNP
jgi:hypothetical protein